MMDAIDLLRHRLAKEFSNFTSCDSFGKPELMSQVLAEVRSMTDDASLTYSEHSIGTILLNYHQTGELPTYLDLKYACFGICLRVGVDRWRLIDDDKLFNKLLRKVGDEQKKPRRFRKCFQGLLSGYFSYTILANNMPENGRKNWRSLRTFLNEKLYITQKTPPVAKWTQVLAEHSNLFSTTPCKRYGTALLRGDSSEFNSVCGSLGIPTDSWVREETISAHINTACRLIDDQFTGQLEQLLVMVTRNPDINLSDKMKKRCISELVRRYAKCFSTPEHATLRDASVTIIGNPWLHRVAWDTFVDDEKARQMIDSWLKRQLITDFFQLLSEDGSTDQRRLNYWLRFEPYISDMWFALGPYAHNHHGANFREFRKRAHGRLVKLEHGGRVENNAFIMNIDEYVIVEFGVIGNACYIFKKDNLSFDLENKWIRGDDYHLKSPKKIYRLLHQNSRGSGFSWEEKFDIKLRVLLNSMPKAESSYKFLKTQPSTPPNIKTKGSMSQKVPELFEWNLITNFLNRHGIKMQDNRDKGGAFWVLVGNNSSFFNERLERWGFHYKTGKGWWKE